MKAPIKTQSVPLSRDRAGWIAVQAWKNRGQKFTLRLLNLLAGRMPVTIICHGAENQERCHRHLLQRAQQSQDGQIGTRMKAGTK